MTVTPAEVLLTPAQVAAELGLHVRTVRRHIRDGLLPAVRIGKRYRVPRDALRAVARSVAASASASATATAPAQALQPRPQVSVSSIVDIDSLSAAQSERVVNMLLAAIKARSTDDAPLHLESLWDPQRQRLKLVLLGSSTSTATILRLLDALTEGL